MKRGSVKVIVESLGQKYSQILDIRLEEGRDNEIFKWFLASVLFGAPITESSATKTYKCFEKHNVLTPERILKTGWDGLVKILDEGTYTRYDFKTADKLLEIARNLTKEYGGSLSALNEKASDARDLERRLKSLGKGVGNVTVSIFLRDLRDIWEKANPSPTSLVILAAENLGILKKTAKKDALSQLKDFWAKNKVKGKTFINFETALLRLGKDYYRKGKSAAYPVKGDCLSRKAP
jgi:endonuclease III